MSRDLKTYKQLRAYLSGKLGIAEKEAFEKELQTPEARDWLRVHTAIEEAGDQQYREMFKSLHEEMKPKQQRRIFLLWGTLAALAVIALFFLLRGLFPGFSTSSTESLYAQNYQRPGVVERGDSVEVPDPLDLMAEFEQKDTLTPLQHRSLGIAYLETGQFEKAILSFEEIGYETFMKDEALWYQALAALKLEKLEVSASYLQTLLNEPKTQKTSLRPKAEQLLQEIKLLIQEKKGV